MKKTTTLFVLFCVYLMVLGNTLFAQPMRVNTMTPLPVGTTDSIYGAAVSVPPGAGGAGVTWNLSTLSPILQGTITIVTPSSTPYFSTFPSTTFCAKLTPTVGSSVYIYERVSSSKWEQLANNYSGVGTGTDYTPNPESVLEFPMSYGNSFIDTFQKTTGGPNTTTITYDGYGTLITPFATYTNVVRIYKYWGPGDYAYNWYVTTPHLAIIAVYDAQGNAYSIVREGGTTGINEISAAASAQVYPNPFSGCTTLKIDAPNGFRNASIIITDAVGKVVRQLPVNSSETVIQRDGLSPGLYFYAVVNNEIKIANGKLIIN